VIQLHIVVLNQMLMMTNEMIRTIIKKGTQES